MPTEEQARRRFCPRMLVVSEDGQSHGNRWGNDVFDQAAAKRGDHAAPLNCCIASECMAWRWADIGMVERRVYNGTLDYDGYSAQRFAKPGETFFQFDGAWWHYEHSSSDSKGAYDLIVRSSDEGATVMVGFCGLAGKVED